MAEETSEENGAGSQEEVEQQDVQQQNIRQQNIGQQTAEQPEDARISTWQALLASGVTAAIVMLFGVIAICLVDNFDQDLIPWVLVGTAVTIVIVFAMIPVFLRRKIASVVSVLALISIVLSVWVAYDMSKGFSSEVVKARVLITVFFVLGTISLALIIAMSALMSGWQSSEGLEYIKTRLDFAKQVFAGLVGILGTVVGFYFGVSGESTGQLAIARIAPEAIYQDDTTTAIVVETRGGKLPIHYTLTLFRNDTEGEHEVNSFHGVSYNHIIKREIEFSAPGEDYYGIRVTVTDELGREHSATHSPIEWTREGKRPDSAEENSIEKTRAEETGVEGT